MTKKKRFKSLSVQETVEEVRRFRHNLIDPILLKSIHDVDVEWIEAYLVPQSIQFMVDCLPTIQQLLKQYSRDEVVSFLDVGTAAASGANLLAELHCSNMIWCRVEVDAIDIDPLYKSYSEFRYPLVNYMVGDIFALPEQYQWDVVFSSATIEHLDDPTSFISELKRRSRDWVILYAPFEEWNRIDCHRFTFTNSYISAMNPEKVEIIRSLGWNPLPDEDRSMFLAVLKGEARLANDGMSPDDLLRIHNPPLL